MSDLQEVTNRELREHIDNLEIHRVEDGLIIEHRNASHFVAEIDLRSARLTIPVTAEFHNHLEYDGDELVDRALDQLEPRLRRYVGRGYRIRETEFQPGSGSRQYEKVQIPVFVAYLDRQIEDRDELFDELDWLLERLPDK